MRTLTEEGLDQICRELVLEDAAKEKPPVMSRGLET
jgi:hypothetical protein